jgi:hypothetical protein
MSLPHKRKKSVEKKRACLRKKGGLIFLRIITYSLDGGTFFRENWPSFWPTKK